MVSATASTSMPFASEMCWFTRIAGDMLLLSDILISLLRLQMLQRVGRHASVRERHQNWVLLWWDWVIAVLVLHAHYYWIPCSKSIIYFLDVLERFSFIIIISYLTLETSGSTNSYNIRTIIPVSWVSTVVWISSAINISECGWLSTIVNHRMVLLHF